MQTKHIFTPTTMYADFTQNLPIRGSVAGEERVGDVVYRQVFFNGREVAGDKVSIYGIYAAHDDGKRHNAILILPDCSETVDIKIINLYVHLGYDVLMIDYRGEVPDSENHTNYPAEINYANYASAGRHLDYADESARETCWYEWTCVAHYAVSYLYSHISSNKVGVLGIKGGSEVMWHLISCDSRVACAVGLFGAGWRSYRGIRKYGENNTFEIDDERIRFMAGVDAHAFAPYAKCPVALFAATNSPEYDADRAHDTMRRVNEKQDVLFCLSPRMSSAVNINCTRNIELFFGVYLGGQRIQLPAEPTLKMKVNGDNVTIEVTTPPEPKPRSVEFYVCENQIEPAKRNWVNPGEAQKVSDTLFRTNYSLVDGGELLLAIAVVEYRNGVTVSTPIVSQKCPKTPIIKTNLLFSSVRGTDDFTFGVAETDVIAKALYYKRSPIELVRGPMGIFGVTCASGLINFRPGENRVEIKRDSVFKLDVYCKEAVTLYVRLATNVGSSEERVYNANKDVPCGEVWQTVILELKDFKDNDYMQVQDFNAIDEICFEASGFFAINNVLLI